MNAFQRMKREQKKQKKIAEQQEASREAWADFCKRADAAILYTLWKDFGFGKKRLERFYRKLIINSETLYEKYDSTNDGEKLDENGQYKAIDKSPIDLKGRLRYYAMRRFLKDYADCDVEAMQKWEVAEIKEMERQSNEKTTTT